jgi:hypothetical protein
VSSARTGASSGHGAPRLLLVLEHLQEHLGNVGGPVKVEIDSGGVLGVSDTAGDFVGPS